MTKKPRLEVIQESPTGLNQKFKDNLTGEIVTRGQVAKNINNYDDYHVMKVGGKNVIRSNPDGKAGNNLG
jgi:hypothetical protein